MPEVEVHMIDHLSKMEGRLPDDSYARMTENDDLSKRLKMLFKPEDGEREDAHNDELEKAYETVNEGDTTDTTSGIDDEAALASTKRMDNSSTATQVTTAASSDGPKKAVEEGIKSSDDEEEEVAVVAKEPLQEAEVEQTAETAQRTTVE